jgi:hypothetical protein
VAIYRRVFERARSASLRGEDSIELIARIAGELG